MTKAEDIGPYQIIKEIGRGAMGVVYHARHNLTHKDVALKVVFENVAASFSGAERFRREVKIASIVQDEGIVEVFDAQEHDGKFWYAMELLEGEDLEERFDALDRKELLDIIDNVLETLAKCHEKGIVHRDLKPENIYIVSTENGYQTKILDFGIASIQASPTATQTGYALGTPAYMSPEQAMNPKAAGPTSDVWSVGIMLYRMVHRKLPFEADSPTAVMMKVVNEELPPMPEQLPSQLRSIIERCLRKKPEDRFSNAATLLEALRLTPMDTGLDFPDVDDENLFVTAGSGDGTVDSAPPRPASIDVSDNVSATSKSGMWIAAGILTLTAVGLLIALGSALAPDSTDEREIAEPSMVVDQAPAEKPLDETPAFSEESTQLESAQARSNARLFSARKSAIEASKLKGEELQREDLDVARSATSLKTREKRPRKKSEPPPTNAEKTNDDPTPKPSEGASNSEGDDEAQNSDKPTVDETTDVAATRESSRDPDSVQKPQPSKPTQQKRPTSSPKDEAPSKTKATDKSRPEEPKKQEKPSEKKDPEPDFFTF